MRFFGRKTRNNVHKEDELDEFLYSSSEEKVDTDALQAELRCIRQQIADAKEEHEEILAKLMPAKWELLDKKEQISRIKSEYSEVSSKLFKAKTELDDVMRKLNSSKPDDNYNTT